MHRVFLHDAKELLEMAEGENDEEAVNGIVSDLTDIDSSITSFEFKRMFSGEMDQNSALFRYSIRLGRY